MTEEWRLISLAPKYEISNFGRVRHIRLKRILKVYLKNKKYPNSTLQTIFGERPVPLARQVLLAFGFKFPPKAVVGYKDGDSKNIRADNLFWEKHSVIRKKLWKEGVYKNRNTYFFTREDLKKALLGRRL